jgi:hypothetical protein
MTPKNRIAKGLPRWPTNGLPLDETDELVIQEFVRTGKKYIAYKKYFPNDNRTMSPINYFSLPLVDQRLKDYANSLCSFDAVIDSKLIDIITDEQDKNTVVAAIKEYNKLRNRIVESVSIKTTYDTSKLTDEELTKLVTTMMKKMTYLSSQTVNI